LSYAPRRQFALSYNAFGGFYIDLRSGFGTLVTW